MKQAWLPFDVLARSVSIIIPHQSLADLEENISMGFKEGFTMILTYLEKLLNNLNV